MEITPSEAIKIAQSKLSKDTKLYVSVYDMQTGESNGQNANVKLFRASTIKVLYAAVYYSCLESGRFNLDTVHVLKKEDKYSKGTKVGGTGVLKNQPNGTEYTHRELLSHMITDSDNIAANIITRIVGFDTIMKKAKEWGLSNTSCQREMYDATSHLPQNKTTMHDLTELLKLIESGRIINTENRGYLMEDMKAAQKDRLGKYAPNDVIVANKTGEVSHTRADIGIVYFKNRKPLIISALVKRDNRKQVSASTVEEVIGTMARNLIDYYQTKF
jgi:beta-lactamase class A